MIGRGLVGSAAARHLAEAGVSTVLIGPGEPASYQNSRGPFSSHYDEGRITRITASDQVWSELAARSIRRYDDIAQRSGVDFYVGRGLAYVSTNEAVDYESALGRGADARVVSAEWLRETTGIAVPETHAARIIYEGAPAGFINPRRMIEAQCRLAETAGATIIDAAATGLSAGSVTIDGHGPIEASKVLLATGAYGGGLAGVDLPFERRLRTIVMAELGPGTEIPSLIVDNLGHRALDGIYWVPPVRFPDGRTMLKIGGDSLPVHIAETDDDVTTWFHQGGSEDEVIALRETIHMLLPDATVTSWAHKPCVVTYTPNKLPYVDWLDDGVAVAAGGSGSAGKSADEIGRLAANLVHPIGSPEPEMLQHMALNT